MGPQLAAGEFRRQCPAGAVRFRATLYGSLGATGRGHLTDQVLAQALAPAEVAIQWRPDETLPEHPNGVRFEGFDKRGGLLLAKVFYSIGGGAIKEEGVPVAAPDLYEFDSLSRILAWCEETGRTIHDLVLEREGPGMEAFLAGIWRRMNQTIEEGLADRGFLPGGLKVARRARSFHAKARRGDRATRRTGLVFAYALAAAERNASGETVVTAPTCGACGVLPAVLRHLHEDMALAERDLVAALATAGLVGNLVKRNASISGAEAGCQAEVGVACSMAAAAAAELMGGSLLQVEYAAEMGLEHHLGLTCDPVAGLVQIPCIERNAHAAARALDCAEYALLSDGRHRVAFDAVVETMRQTGRDLARGYRETAEGGLARVLHPAARRHP